MALNTINSDRLEELTRECIMDLRPWPEGHVLHVKCRARKGVPMGRILREELTYAPGIQVHQDNREIWKFRTIDDLLEAGWVVD